MQLKKNFIDHATLLFYSYVPLRHINLKVIYFSDAYRDIIAVPLRANQRNSWLVKMYASKSCTNPLFFSRYCQLSLYLLVLLVLFSRISRANEIVSDDRGEFKWNFDGETSGPSRNEDTRSRITATMYAFGIVKLGRGYSVLSVKAFLNAATVPFSLQSINFNIIHSWTFREGELINETVGN